MIHDLIRILDVAALWVLWWCAIAGLAGGHEVRTYKALAINLALIVLMVSAFSGAIALAMQAEPAPWWSTGLRCACATIAGFMYERRFGVGRHLRLLREWALSIFKRRPSSRRHA